jgi:endoglucanase
MAILLLAWFATPPEPDIFERARRLGAGVNFGNALEAPHEGEWGVTLRADYFRIVREAGFCHVRLPVRWSAHAEPGAPYRIEQAFMERVAWAVRNALDNGLAIVVNIHHYDELYEDPDGHRSRFLALWRQIAERFAREPADVYFEILNEPHGRLGGDRWNTLLREALAVIRESNPLRPVIVGPDEWSHPAALNGLHLPEDDRNLIVTFHYYEPFRFTHQGASWVPGSDAWLGTRWDGTEDDRTQVERHFRRAAEWARRHGRPLYLGEFGAYEAADPESRIRWTRCVREAAERHGMAWAYWEFCAGFGAYDAVAGVWREELLRALLGAR